ncbi:uncharacterized protein LOC127866374 [Dreissena polymorpha]|uniref:Uncharacterized protein n=1 Tax=Dreissena polymorpha TaxID=45954 RepID=A0A9D4LQ21_DREPO|nr:uncharacterized protein LOC127866374 [Dreissena polymorpha]KAH3862895.1 hypothetical protein DPMN_025870 [Dreissena polymorpha]
MYTLQTTILFLLGFCLNACRVTACLACHVDGKPVCYDRDQQMCCKGRLHPRVENGLEKRCCNGTVYASHFQQCCDGIVYMQSNTSLQCVNGTTEQTERQLMNQNMILIMIILGLVMGPSFVIFFVSLFCFQQRQRRANRQYETEAGYSDGCDNEHLYAPPPTYNEVIQTNLYPPTPEQLRVRQISEEPCSPMTPPPTHNSALLILARSAESLLQHKPDNKRLSVLSRRSLSLDVIELEQTSPPKQEISGADGHPEND